MPDIRAGCLQGVFSGFDYLEGFTRFDVQSGYTLNLLRIEDGVDPMYEAAVLFIVRGIFCLVPWLSFPILDTASFLALADTPAVIEGLFESHPPGVCIAAHH